MASNQSRFSDERYHNWLTGTLSLLYVKEGIENLVNAEAVVFHTSLLRNLNRQGITPQICSSCTAKSMKKDVRRQVWNMQCPLCNPWLQQIVQHHNYPLKLTPGNTNPQLWTTDPYEVCKAYMPYGCAGNQSANDGDVQGVLSLIKNCCHFTTCKRIGQSQLIDELLEFRNSLFHSGNFLVDDAALQAAHQTMLDFLRGMTSLSTLEKQSVEQAVNNITELQKGTLDFSLNRELELRALQSQQNALDSEQTRLKHEFEQFQTEVDSDVKTLQRDVASLTTKTTTTESDLKSQAVKMEEVDSDVKTLQRDVDSLTTKTTTTESDLESQAVKMEEVDSDVKTLQRDVASLTTKTTTTESDLESQAVKMEEVDSDVKTLQRDVASLTTKTSTTESDLESQAVKMEEVDSDVKTLQRDVASLTTKTTTTESDLESQAVKMEEVDSDVKTLQRDVASLTTKTSTTESDLESQAVKMEEVDSDVKTLQRDVASLTTKTTTTESDLESQAVKMEEVDSDVKTLQRDVASLTTKTSTTESDLESQAVKMEEVGQRLERLQAVQDSFNKFLQANNLVQDMARLSTALEHHVARLSTALEHHEHRIENLTTHSQRLDVTTEKQKGEIATLYQRQQAHHGRLEHVDTELQERLRDSQALKFQQQAHSTMLASHQGRLEHVEERLQNPTGIEASEMTDETITALRVSLIKHYRDNSLHVKIPVVDQELAIEDIYVVPEIKVLREADKPRGVLSTVQNPESTRNTSICKQIFYTKAYKNNQIYTTADAGMGKTTFCKYLVNLWCEAHNESQSDSPELQTDSPELQTDSPESQSDNPESHSDSLESQSDSPKSQSESPESQSGNPTQSNSSDKYLQGQKTRAIEEDKTIMSSFKLLFYITLRDSAKLYKLDEMIDSQILQSSRKPSSLKASDVLQTEGCLVIIDGLDEWACPEGVEVPHYVNPGIPGKLDFNSNTVFLTTTRPWKYEVLNLSNKDVDKYAELVGFDSKSADDLCFKLFKVMNKAESVKKDVQAFKADIQKGRLSHLFNIPVILTVLVCLWFDKQSLGMSRVQLYCSMLEMLLRQADKNFPKQTCASKSETACEEMQLPECILNHEHCQKFQLLLVKLCKVAFEALFNKEREHTLVFKSTRREILGVDHINVDLCLKSGILSQTKVLGKWSGSEKKLSFLHKSLQEFLAAVFITFENAEPVILRVKQFCTSVESMLEMSQVWMFLSGINCDDAKPLLIDFMTSVALKDSRLQQYRHTLTDFYEVPALVRSIQTCILACVEEATCNGNNDFCLPLEDFVINKQTISTCLERLLTFNTAAIKSVHIDTRGMEPDTVEHVMCQLQDTQCLQKLHQVDLSSAITNMQSLHQVDPSSDITNMQSLCKTLANNKDSLTCLQLVDITLTTELCDAVCSVLTHVTVLGLWRVTLTHKQREQLLLSVSQAQHIRQLQLGLDCTDHGRQCRAGIDVSGLTQLRTLDLGYMYIARLPVMTDCLESVVLWYVTISESQLRQFIHALSSTSNTLEVGLYQLTVTEVIDKSLYLTDLIHNPKLVVTVCWYSNSDNTWYIEFHTKQQTTTASDNQN